MKLSDEKLADFNSRMNSWMSEQGLLFQLTHGGSGLGGRSPVADTLVRLIISAALIALLLLIGTGGYLIYHARSDDFSAGLESTIGKTLSAQDIRATGFSRTFNSGQFGEIYAVGGDESFFTGLEARAIQFPMSLPDGIIGNWNANRIQIESAFVHLTAGATTDAKAEKMWQSLFQQVPGFTFKTIGVYSANLSWGYTAPATWGSIRSSKLTASRVNDGFQIHFQGGSFSQGLLRDFKIESIRLSLQTNGDIIIQEAVLSSEGGTLTLTGKLTEKGATPVFECEGTFEAIPTKTFLLPNMRDKVLGNLSGTISAKGSPNRKDGISYELKVTASDKSPLILTDALPLLEMANVLDTQNGFRKLIFNGGSLVIKTEEEKVYLSDIDLTSVNSDTGSVKSKLTGSLMFYPSTMKELSQESVLLNELYEDSLQAGASELAEIEEKFQDEVRRRYADAQPTYKEIFYGVKTLDNSGVELKKPRIEPYLRSSFRPPAQAKGSLQLTLRYRSFAMTEGLDHFHVPATGDFAKVEIAVDGLAIHIGRLLAQQWQEALRAQSRPAN